MRSEFVANRWVEIVYLLLFSGCVFASGDLGEASKRLAECTLAEELVRHVENVKIDVGGAYLWLDEGVVYPINTAGDLVREVVFRGRGRISYEPARQVERSQLDLFTGGESLNESFDQAVLAVGGPSVAEAISGGSPISDSSEMELDEAAATACGWRERPEYRMFGVSRGLLLAELGEADYERFFAAWMATPEHGDILLIHDPERREGLGIGRYDVFDGASLAQGGVREHLSGDDFLGGELGNDAVWNWWTRDVARGMASRQPYAEDHVEVEVWLGGPKLEMSAKARIRLSLGRTARETVLLTLPKDFEVDAVRSALGIPLEFRMEGSLLLARLEEPAAADSILELEIDYHGSYLKPDGRGSFSSRSGGTLDWYPRILEPGRPTIHAIFHWPKVLRLFASGERSKEQESDTERTAAFALDNRSVGMAFEIGAYRVLRFSRDGRTLQIATPRQYLGWVTIEDDSAVASDFWDLLAFEEYLLGPLSIEHFTIVYTKRNFSQATWPMITLSTRAWAHGDNSGQLLAHELVHMWWGNLIGWESYRDQWLSEAMAEYLAAIWARARAKNTGKEWEAPWMLARRSLQIERGRSILTHQAGPVTLGYRLRSSTCPDCYVPIVYGKGPMIFGTLEALVGEQRWLACIQKLSRWARHKQLSTELFQRAVEKLLDTDLEPVFSNFVHKAGFPQVGFTYETTQLEDGRYRTDIQAYHRASARIRFKIRTSSHGEFDVQQIWSSDYDAEDSALAVPVRVVTEIAEVGDTSGIRMVGRYRRASDEWSYQEEKEKRVFKGEDTVIPIKGTSASLTVHTELEPLAVQMNTKNMVLAMPECWSCFPKQAAALRSLRAAWHKEGVRAQNLAALAFATEPTEGDRVGIYRHAKKSRRKHWWDSIANMSLAVVALDGEQLDQAKGYLRKAGSNLVLDPPRWITNFKHRLDARLLLLRGKHRKAYNTLWRRVLNGDDNSLDGFFLLAVASIQIGEEKTLEKIEPVFAWSGYDLERIRLMMETARTSD